MAKQSEKQHKKHGTGCAAGFFFLLVSLLLHAVLILPLRMPEEENGKKNGGSTGRRDSFLDPSHPEFRQIAERMKNVSDPAEFIRGGGKNGYSAVLARISGRTATEAEPPPILYPGLKEPQSGELPPVFTVRESADLFSYPEFLAELLLTEKPPVQEETPHYPLWLDAKGAVLRNIDENEENKKALFLSNDVTGPTELIVRFENDLPPSVRVLHSSGSVNLDLYAREQLLECLQGNTRQLGLDPKYNHTIRIFWQKEKTGKEMPL